MSIVHVFKPEWLEMFPEEFLTAIEIQAARNVDEVRDFVSSVLLEALDPDLALSWFEPFREVLLYGGLISGIGIGAWRGHHNDKEARTRRRRDAE